MSPLDRNPAVVLKDLRDERNLLAQAAEEFGKAATARAQAEVNYEEAVAKEMLTIFNTAKDKGERPPAEDIRKALAHKAVDKKVWSDFLTAKAREDAIKQWLQTHRSILSSLQTELTEMREELKST